MTTIEFYYLALCVGALSLFAVALSFNAASWKSWKKSQETESAAKDEGRHVTPQAKLAA